MKFKEWQQTAQYVSGTYLEQELEIDLGGSPPAAAMLYDGRYYIERVDFEAGTWMLQLENWGEVTGDLLLLEKKLYSWIVAEGAYTFDIDYKEAQLEDIIAFIEKNKPTISLDKGTCSIYLSDEQTTEYTGESLRDAVYQAVMMESIEN